MNYKYRIVSYGYDYVEFINSSYKATIFLVDGTRFNVAFVGDDWWLCDESWSTNLRYDHVSDSVGRQLNKFSERYINDLIVGAQQSV